MELLIPTYDGLESENEDIVYRFFREIGEKYGFILRVKKSRTDVDKFIASKNTGELGEGKADGYIISDTKKNKDFLVGIIELKTTGKIDIGIKDCDIYNKSIKHGWKELFDNNKYFINIVFDGKSIYLAKVYSKKVEIIYNMILIDKTNQKSITETLIKEILKLNPIRKTLKQVNEESLINLFKKKVRGKEELQKFRAELMTVLASIYDLTEEENLIEAIDILNKKTTDIAVKISKSWDKVKIKVNFENYRDTIKEIYNKITIKMYDLAKEKNMDLYGYFYEELAEKDNKKENGEYYTPRHIITPIIKSIYNNYLKHYNWNKDTLDNYIVADPFCGSGGFLYEYLKIISKKFNISDDINRIAQYSLYGFDIIDTSSALLNMYLVGDGNLNLEKVTSSIGWRYRYVREAEYKKNYTSQAIKESLETNSKTINSFLSIYLSSEQLQQLRIQKYIDANNNMTNKMIDELCLVRNNIPIYQGIDEFFYEKLLNEDDKKISNLSIFGNTDLLMTNVPYGTMDELEKKKNGCYLLNSARLETNALKECVDLLKPEVRDGNGNTLIHGGIGIIVVPSGILETKENLEIRRYLIKNTKILGIIKLPKYTFAPYAAIQTYIIIIQKRSLSEILSYKNTEDLSRISFSNVFMYTSDVDGKATSTKRYPVDDMDVLDDRFGLEFIHDDFSDNYGNFNGDYKSKLERCWDYDFWKMYSDYNQLRITDNWIPKDGKMQWEILPGRKWGYFNIEVEEKQYVNIKYLDSKIVNEIGKYCKLIGIDVKCFCEYLSDDKVNLELVDDKGKTIFKLGAEILKANKNKLYYDDTSINNKFRYIEIEKYYDIDFRPEKFLEDKNLLSLNFSINERINEDDFSEYYVWEIFNAYGEENITESYIYKNRGEYPVYSGQTKDNGVIGYIKDYTHDGEYLTWTTYGSAGVVFYRNGKFSIGRNCAGLKLKNKYKNIINVKYAKLLLDRAIKESMNSADSRGSAPLGLVLSIKLKFPPIGIQNIIVDTIDNDSNLFC